MKKIIKEVINEIRPAIVCLVIFTVICGLLYTGIITGIGQLLFPGKANGSIVTVVKDGAEQQVGSELIAQQFTKPEYLIGRPSGTSNLSTTSDELRTLGGEEN